MNDIFKINYEINMKSFNLIFQIFISIAISLVIIFWFTGMNSAFEADQECHYLLSTFSNETEDYGCDHDLETHQWILYIKSDSNNPAKVLKRFRYRFL